MQNSHSCVIIAPTNILPHYIKQMKLSMCVRMSHLAHSYSKPIWGMQLVVQNVSTEQWRSVGANTASIGALVSGRSGLAGKHAYFSRYLCSST